MFRRKFDFRSNFKSIVPIILSRIVDLWQRLWNEKKEKAAEIPEKISSIIKIVDPVAFPTSLLFFRLWPQFLLHHVHVKDLFLPFAI